MAQVKKNRDSAGHLADQTPTGAKIKPTKTGGIQAALGAPSVMNLVGIGASAGGLEALQKLVRHLPHNTKQAYVVVQHLSATHRSLLKSLLARESNLAVQEITSGMVPEPNNIYVTPTRANLIIQEGKFVLAEGDQSVSPKPSVDEFFISLAEEFGENAIGIVLSGTGSDGARGIRAIFAAGGVTIAQEEATAKYNGMPHAAIETNCISYILSPEVIGQKLSALQMLSDDTASLAEPTKPTLDQICDIVKQQSSINLRIYKESTLRRRIRRRLVATDSPSPEAYLELLKSNPSEVQRLSLEVLISVTAFFRDYASFAELAMAIDTLVAGKQDGEQLRIWVPGCATGEEAYSISILVAEAIRRHGHNITAQIFATDIDANALNRARKGRYRTSDIENVPEEFRSKYFSIGHRYADVSKTIRDCIVFSIHNLSSDPPFLRLDLVSCRNVLIYFQPIVQQRIMWSFSYALLERGLLFLGRSESTLNYEKLFAPISEKSRLFQRLPSSGVARQLLSNTERFHSLAPPLAIGPVGQARESSTLNDRIIKALGTDLLKVALVVDESMQLRYIFGDVSKFIRIPAGEVKFDLMTLLATEVRVDVRAAIIRVQREPDKTVSFEVASRSLGEGFQLHVTLMPGETQTQDLFLIRFETKPMTSAPPTLAENDYDYKMRLAELENQLEISRSHLQTVIEELETSNEELQSLNEEMQSSNEELQSTNEELETTNEELQSTNEELTTVNDELKAKTIELHSLNNVLVNVRDSLIYPLIVVDELQRVILFNPSAKLIFTVDDLAIGESLYAFPMSLSLPDLKHQIAEVINLGRTVEQQIIDQRCYAMMIRPYVDHLGQRRGAVLSFVDNTSVVLAERSLIEANQRLSKAESFIRATFDASPNSTCIVDESGFIVEVNRVWQTFMADNGGVVETCGTGVNYLSVCAKAAANKDSDAAKFRDGLAGVLTGALDDFSMDYPCHSPDVERWFSVTVSPFYNAGRRMAMVIHTDITDRKQNDLQVRLQSRALDACVNGIFIADARQPTLPLIYVNSAFEKITDYSRAEILGQSSHFLYGVEGQQLGPKRSQIDLSALQVERKLLNSQRKDGSSYWVELAVYPIDDENDQIGYLVGVQHDVSEIVASERALKVTLDHERLAFNFAGIGTFEWDIRKNWISYSKTCLRLLGFADDMQQSHHLVLRNRIHPDDQRIFDEAVRLCLIGHSHLDLEIRIIWENGEVRWLHVRGDTKSDDTDLPIELHCLIQDITDRKATEDRVRYTALHDNLTGLPNRTLLRERMQAAITFAERNQSSVAIIFIDLDHFKAINDSLGHHMGDMLLKAVADRLMGCVHIAGTVGRLSGDEYVVVMPSGDNTNDIRNMAIKIVDTLSVPFVVEQQELVVTSSIGISVFPNDGEDIDTLMRNADLAMYRAKTNGRRGYHFFMPQLDQHVTDQFRFVAELRRALEQHELEVYYQPQYHVSSGKMVAIESLVRWNHPSRGIVLPEHFIQLAESTDMIYDVDLYVLKASCIQAQQWHAQNLLPCPIAVNFSPLHSQRINIIDVIQNILRESNLPPQLLELELTERSIIISGEEAVKNMRTVHDIGVRIALDDFGTGYSSLSYLMRFPIDKIKIDRSFVSRIAVDDGAAAVIRAVIGLGQSLKLEVVAEGVETAEQLSMLRQEHCNSFQGYLANPAMRSEELTQQLRLAESTPLLTQPQKGL